ncbi:NAD(P)/FAD-dependent oxidoreductase [bacterium]|nr:NAD(P)/FAD-dependent oxidoreductase [bacterium]
MINKNKEYDCIIIGGGPAGMMAAIGAVNRGKKVLVIEKNQQLGKKLLLTGDGRCNLSHLEKNNKDFVKNFGTKGDFLLSPFSIFGPRETFDFFEKERLALNIENDGRVFPKSNKSKDVLITLKKMLEGVDILYGKNVKVINVENGIIKSILLHDDSELKSKSYILCAGGKSFPSTGSDGSGFSLAKSVGHTIVNPVPGLVPIKIKQKWVKKLMGITMKDVAITFYANSKKIIRDRGSILFTHFGITGPIILNASNELGKHIAKKITIEVDLFPDKNVDDLKKEIFTLIGENKNKKIKNIFEVYFSEKLLLAILNFCEIDCNKKAREIKKDDILRMCNFVKKVELEFESLESFEISMATNGGVSLNEINSKNMRSKIIKNLYFAGEIVDLIGKTGGYNLQMCWTTGYVAGNSC